MFMGATNAFTGEAGTGMNVLSGETGQVISNIARYLKKQGLLALTFRDSAEYDRIREDERISLVGLASLAPGKPAECRIRHADGTTETLLLAHSYGASQMKWFRAGSALNLFHDGQTFSRPRRMAQAKREE